MSLLEVTSLQKIYTTRLGGSRVQALKSVSFSVEQGEFVAIMGESGSGKDHAPEHSGRAGSAHRRPGEAGRPGSGRRP